MSETFEHNPGDHEDPLAGVTWYIGFVGAVAFVVITLAVWALYYNVKGAQVEESFVIPVRDEIIELRRTQQHLLEGPPRTITVDEAGVMVTRRIIPIEQAMKIVVEENAR